MLNVGKIENGIVLDHIQAGKSMLIYHYLELNKLDCTVAIIKNARSNAMGKKDILKIETDAHSIDLDVIAFIDPDVTDRAGSPAHVLSRRFKAQHLPLPLLRREIY